MDDSCVRVRGKKRKGDVIDIQELRARLSGTYKKMRTERRTFKNLRVCFTKLSGSPKVSNVRSKQQDTSPSRRSGRFSTRDLNGKVNKPLDLSKQAPGSWRLLDDESHLESFPIPPNKPQTIISEPYWLAGSDSASIWTIETAPPEFDTKDFDYQVTRGFVSELSLGQGHCFEERAASTFLKGGRSDNKKTTTDLGRRGGKLLRCLRCKFLMKTVGNDEVR